MADQGRNAAASELHIELLPGTEIMTDTETHHFVKGAHRTVLIPQPSDDPNDPLNWSTLWKGAAITSAAMATFTQGFGALALAPLFPDLMEAFDCSLADAVQFTGICILVLGFSNFIWVPISTSFGRRPVFILSQIINLGSSVWRGKASSYGSFMGACIVNGISAGPGETIMPDVIADIFFLHDRGKWNTLYWVVYMGSLMVAPIVSGSMALNVGWRNFWWLNMALIGVSILMVLFMFPETRYRRDAPKDLATPALAPAPSDEKLKADSLDSKDARSAENQEPIQQAPTATSAAKELDGLSLEETTARDPYLGKGAPAKWQWRVFQPNAHPLKSIIRDLWTPWKLFAFPIVEFSSFVVSWSCSGFLVLNLTQSQVFAAPPYSFSSQSIGFMNFAILIGAILGLLTAGPLSDWTSAYFTRRNNGIREPEMRLAAMIPYIIIMFIGNIVVAVGYERKWPWEAIVIIGFTCAGIQVAALPAISSTYAVDSYKPVAGSLFVAITVNKNMWGYGVSKFITPWTMEAGYIAPIMTNAALILFFCLCGGVFWKWGKVFRRWTRNSSVHVEHSF